MSKEHYTVINETAGVGFIRNTRSDAMRDGRLISRKDVCVVSVYDESLLRVARFECGERVDVEMEWSTVSAHDLHLLATRASDYMLRTGAQRETDRRTLNYTTMTDKHLKQLAQHGRLATVRTAAQLELDRREQDG